MSETDLAIEEYHLNTTTEKLQGASKELLIVNNQWAAVGLDQAHKASKANFEISLNGVTQTIALNWDSNFPKDAMKSKHNIAEFGGVSLACFVMCQIYDYNFLVQTEIGEGVDYWFTRIEEPTEDVLEREGLYIEISGILDGQQADIDKRIKKKHSQIDNGTHGSEPSAVIVSCLNMAKTAFEYHGHENS